MNTECSGFLVISVVTCGDRCWSVVVALVCQVRARRGPVLRVALVPGPFPGGWAGIIPGRSLEARR